MRFIIIVMHTLAVTIGTFSHEIPWRSLAVTLGTAYYIDPVGYTMRQGKVTKCSVGQQHGLLDGFRLRSTLDTRLGQQFHEAHLLTLPPF